MSGTRVAAYPWREQVGAWAPKLANALRDPNTPSSVFSTFCPHSKAFEPQVSLPLRGSCLLGPWEGGFPRARGREVADSVQGGRQVAHRLLTHRTEEGMKT